MGTHIEEFDAHAVVAFALPLTEVGSEEIPAGNYAITIEQDSVTMITGTAEDLHAFATRMLTRAQTILEHAARPLTYDDFIFDSDDRIFLCPRCTEELDPADSTVAGLIHLVDTHIDSHRPKHER